MNPYALLAVILFLVGSHTTAYFQGRGARDDEVKVENAALAAKTAEAYRVQVEYGNKKAAEVQELERASTMILTGVLTNVPKVTTNRPCLSRAAVSLLNGSSPAVSVPTSAPSAVAEISSEAASDTDIAGWIAKANAQYESCAANNNGIVDILVKP